MNSEPDPLEPVWWIFLYRNKEQETPGSDDLTTQSSDPQHYEVCLGFYEVQKSATKDPWVLLQNVWDNFHVKIMYETLFIKVAFELSVMPYVKFIRVYPHTVY